ncbi:MAG: hypothetical protein ACREBZ_06690 [Thermoplasmata archaeon]
MSAVAESIRCNLGLSAEGRWRVEVASVYVCDRPEEVVELVRELSRAIGTARPSEPGTNVPPI